DLVYPLADVRLIEIPIPVTDQGVIADVDVGFRMNHELNTDLVVSIVHPDGTKVDLYRHGGSFIDRNGKNFGDGPNTCYGRMMTFDDAAEFPIWADVAPYT